MNKNSSWIDSGLDRALKFMERDPQAVLIDGAAGIGKTELAVLLSAALLCETHGGRRPACRQCQACLWFEQGNHPDFRVLRPLVEEGSGKAEGSFEIRIPQVREIAEFVTIGAHRAGRRVVLVDPADALNTISANALLKTLEEPTPGLTFLLVSSQPSRLPATIRSRCLRFTVRAPLRAEVVADLQAKTGLTPTAIEAALDAAGGSPREALFWLDPANRAVLDATLTQIASLPEADPMSVADRLGTTDIRLWSSVLRRWVHDLARRSAGAEPRSFNDHLARLTELAGRTSLERLSAVSRQLDRQSAVLSRPLNPRLFCETLLFDYLQAYRA